MHHKLILIATIAATLGAIFAFHGRQHAQQIGPVVRPNPPRTVVHF